MRAFRSRATHVVALATAITLFTPQLAWSAPLPSLSSGSSVESLPSLKEDVAPPVPPAMEQLGLTGLRLTAPYSEPAGQIRTTFGAPGPHDTEATVVSRECSTLSYQVYNLALKYQNGINSLGSCWNTKPAGTEPMVGSQLIYPADIASMDPAPLVLLTPGIGTEPGMMERQARVYASHGYVVAVGYTWVNWFGYQTELAASAAMKANTTPGPLNGKIDSSRTILVGHSAGGGAVMRVAEHLTPTMREAGDPNFDVKGVVAVNPGPADFGLASDPTTRPALVLLAEHETLVPYPLSEKLYQDARGPKWLATVNNAFHGTFLDDPERNIYAGLVLSFAEYTLSGSPRSVAVYEGDGLAKDSELQNVQQARG